ncbi:MAG: hypothetical protein LCH38_13050 [Proteobacteria bacterium]|nr:hypothetical protein [Pseudomonadota bacterium]
MTTKQTLKNRLSNLALALALSAGTVGGMMSIALTADIAQAANIAGGHNGGGHNGGGNNGNGADGGAPVMRPNEPRSFARAPRAPRVAAPRGQIQKCEGNSSGSDNTHCRFETRPARIVSTHGFANCALIEQTRYGEFYCARPM